MILSIRLSELYKNCIKISDNCDMLHARCTYAFYMFFEVRLRIIYITDQVCSRTPRHILIGACYDPMALHQFPVHLARLKSIQLTYYMRCAWVNNLELLSGDRRGKGERKGEGEG